MKEWFKIQTFKNAFEIADIVTKIETKINIPDYINNN